MKEEKAPIAVGEPQIVYQGPYPHKTVIRQDFEFPDGKVRDFYLWGGITNRPVIVFPLTTDHKVILARQWRPGANFGKGGFVYELPGGHPKPGRNVLEALGDELREETGYEPGEVIKLPEFWLDPAGLGVSISAFLARDCRKLGPQELDETEIIKTVEMPIVEWLRKLKAHEPNERDGKTLSVSLLAMLQMGWIAFDQT